MNYQLTLIQFPSGSWGFVGSVPAHLADVSRSGDPISPELIERELRLPASHRSIKTRSWPTREAAEQALKSEANS